MLWPCEMPREIAQRRGTSVALCTCMESIDIERIATLVVRDYGLPFRINSVSCESQGKRVVAFTDPYSAQLAAQVSVWCDSKATPYSVRETLKRALEVAD